MDENFFEGSLVLEKLARINKLEDFFEAIDSDDLKKTKALMKAVDVNAQTIATVLKKIAQEDSEH